MDQYPYVTPFCAVLGACEGSRKLSPGGALYTSCSGTYQFRTITVECTCTCHQEFREIRAMLKKTEPEEAPLMEIKFTSVATSEQTPETEDQSEVSEPETFEPTPTGRKRQGELEHYVYEVVTGAVTGRIPVGEDLTPGRIALEIGLAHHPYKPSEGAVYAVLGRWASERIAAVEKNPFRLLAISDEVRAAGGILAYRERQAKASKTGNRFFFHAR